MSLLSINGAEQKGLRTPASQWLKGGLSALTTRYPMQESRHESNKSVFKSPWRDGVNTRGKKCHIKFKRFFFWLVVYFIVKIQFLKTFIPSFRPNRSSTLHLIARINAIKSSAHVCMHQCPPYMYASMHFLSHKSLISNRQGFMWKFGNSFWQNLCLAVLPVGVIASVWLVPTHHEFMKAIA